MDSWYIFPGCTGVRFSLHTLDQWHNRVHVSIYLCWAMCTSLQTAFLAPVFIMNYRKSHKNYCVSEIEDSVNYKVHYYIIYHSDRKNMLPIRLRCISKCKTHANFGNVEVWKLWTKELRISFYPLWECLVGPSVSRSRWTRYHIQGGCLAFIQRTDSPSAFYPSPPHSYLLQDGPHCTYHYSSSDGPPKFSSLPH